MIKKRGNLKLILFFSLLTFVLTAVVIVTWEQILRPPFFAWVDRKYPGSENVEERWKIQQRVEHFFISLTVDVVVVSILLAIVGRQQRRLVEAQERLAHNEKIAALGQVAAQVAHEVKNPLAGLLLYSMHLKSKVAGQLPQGELALIDKIIETINHLTRTVEQVMNFASPVRLTLRPLDLNQVVRDVMQLAEPQLSGANINTSLVLDEGSVTATFDESAMRAVLLNLISNSIQAMTGGGGDLRVVTQVDGRGVRLTVSDTGIGMNSEQLQKVFEPFYTTRRQGLGLGMAYAQKIIEQHGGTIGIESRPHAGTTIVIEIPAAHPRARLTN
jgi:two-component system sensor histidine kinase HydH